MRVQSVTFFLGLCTAVFAVPHKPQNERGMWKNWQESSMTTVTPTPTPTTPPGDDDDSGEFPFPWPTEWPPIFDNYPEIGGNDDSSSDDVPDANDKSTSGMPDVKGDERPSKSLK
ncbi:hypothetical protein BDV38DRAFT_284518 [Aspergillus pseudotamarii]|uniref:Secreted mucin n=1 Tax=Aspergillus pseudotamarii TaxID=132259 RepID=A0A5N6SMA7_ASPPS|nr:uncharacterized protein BDV38DRAFT_284518 [Aspergillus pseudotamarii]KAE8135838.1 hypothetical protein BDV38DRAFT_284518 [Aspergillus pseudotamarii]